MFLSYGVTSNDQLLALYGFVDESSADERYPLDSPFDKAAEWRRQQEGRQGADGGERPELQQVGVAASRSAALFNEAAVAHLQGPHARNRKNLT